MVMRVINKKIIFIFLALLIISFICLKIFKENQTIESTNNELNKPHFVPEGLEPGNYSEYDIKLTMTKEGQFQVESTIKINNTSEDSWGNLVFYFIPNIFTNSTSEQLNYTLDVPATVHFKNIAVAKSPTEYTLDKDNLTIPLKTRVKPGEHVVVDFSYEFTLPEGGLRFNKINGNYHLAQFYPMVPTYRENKWNKEEYRFRGETYHTGYSDFKVTYDIPEGYIFVSTSEDDEYPGTTVGTFEVSNVKEVFVAILKDPIVIEILEDINIRVFGFENNEELYKEISEIASDSLHYFQEHIGPYPFTQLDIIIDNLGMEYPGIITAKSIYGSNPVNPNSLKNMVVHEIAHQWFYGIISNDPYNDAWLDEGFSNFIQGLYLLSKSEKDVLYKVENKTIEKEDMLPVNLPLDHYEDSSHIYGVSNSMLFNFFENKGDIKEAEKFFKTYYDFYQYKEVNTEEFVRFAKFYFNLNDNTEFESWLKIEE